MEKIKGLKRDSLFYKSLNLSGIYIITLFVGIIITMIWFSMDSIKNNGLINFVISSEWDPLNNKFGIFTFIFGTFLTSVISLIICIPFSLSISLLLSEYYRNGRLSPILTSCVELMAGIPSVIYGFWGLYVLIPLVIKLEIFLGVIPYGAGIFSASIILAIMIIPYATLLSFESLKMVPSHLKEAAYSLGATKFEVICKVVIPHAFSGILAGIILAFGRAVGETMAVTMVIGNSAVFPESIWSMANTMSSLIANEFVENVSELHKSSLINAGLVLLLFTVVINGIGKILIKRYSFKGN